MYSCIFSTYITEFKIIKIINIIVQINKLVQFAFVFKALKAIIPIGIKSNILSSHKSLIEIIDGNQ